MLQEFSQHPQWPVVRKIAETLSARGFQVVLAGGCVRDALLGRAAQDLDIATNATPEQVESCFEKVLHIGKSFGVCRVVEGTVNIEVATFREESDYRDGRHPDTVVYSTLERDALRRDFTCNAMFYDLIHDKLIDLVEGQRDLKARKLVTVGRAEDRFAEDYLRILRGARFAAQLEFQLDGEALKAMASLAPYLAKISRERIQDEFQKAFKSSKPILFFETLMATGVLPHVISDLVWNPTLSQFFQSRISSSAIGWAALLWARRQSGAETTRGEEWLRSWKLSSQCQSEVLALIEGEKYLHMPSLENFVAVMKSSAAEYFSEFWLRLGRDLSQWEISRTRYLVQGQLPRPLVGGEDLIQRGMRPGSEFKKTLDKLYQRQLESPEASKEDLLRGI